jgi:hypothetical protein
MTFSGNRQAVIAFFQLEHRQSLSMHKLGCQGPAKQTWKFAFTNCDVLFDLNQVEKVPTSFGLDGENIMRALFVDAHVDLVGLHLTEAGRRSAKMILQRVASHTRKYVYEPIVADLGQKSLLVGKRVHCDNSWRRIGQLRHREVLVRRQ